MYGSSTDPSYTGKDCSALIYNIYRVSEVYIVRDKFNVAEKCHKNH